MAVPHDIGWLLDQAGMGERSNLDDLSRELGSFTLQELCGLVYHCRVYNPILWVTTNEEAERGDFRWVTLEAACRAELLRRGVPGLPYEPQFKEQLEAYAAYLRRMATIAEYAPRAEFDTDRHRGILVTGLVVILTRHRDEHGSYSHLSLSALDRIPSSEEVRTVVEAFLEGWEGVQEVKGTSGERIRHFLKFDGSPARTGY